MTKFCPNCGKPLEFEEAEICPGCGVTIKAPPKLREIRSREIRSPFLAVVLSFFFAGWGQWYNGKTWDGLKFFGAFLVSYLVFFFFAGMMTIQPLAGIVVVIVFMVIIGIWVYGMYNAYKTAERINKREESFSKKSGLFWLPVILSALAVLLIIVAVIAAFVFFGMTGPTPNPPYTPIYYPTIPPYNPLPTPIQIPYQPPIHYPTIQPYRPPPSYAPPYSPPYVPPYNPPTRY